MVQLLHNREMSTCSRSSLGRALGVVLFVGMGGCGPDAALVPVVGETDGVGTRPAVSLAASGGSERGPLLVVLGDSLTAGLGLEGDQAYPALLQERFHRDGYDLTVVNAGVSGDTTAAGLRRAEWSLAGDVRILIVALGGNDGLRGLPVEQMKQNLTEIVALARDRGIPVLLAGMEAPPNYGSVYTAEFRATFKDVADDFAVAFMPFLLDGVAAVPALNQPDGIHPTAEGSAIVANRVYEALAPLLVGLPSTVR